MSDARTWHFASESVTEGHPDKVADAVSDAILDASLSVTPAARVACETLVTTGTAIIAGEISPDPAFDVEEVVRGTIRAIGYDGFDPGFDADTIEIRTLLDPQSQDISDGVTESYEARHGSTDEIDRLGAGDQGIMFGFACDETSDLMPMPIQLAHRLAERLSEVRHDGLVGFLRPDGKTQVRVEYRGDVPVRVDEVLISTQHSDDVGRDEIEEALRKHVIDPVLGDVLTGSDIPLIVNPSGKFVIGGPVGDAGLTGRKIIVDTYGGYARHGGGAFSGKDPTKVDRSAAYAARHAAKNVVAAGLARRCEIQLAYAIGRAEPFSVLVETGDTAIIDEERLSGIVSELFDFRPAAILQRLGLLAPIFRPTAAYGHFGRPGFPWEELDMVDILRERAGST